MVNSCWQGKSEVELEVSGDDWLILRTYVSGESTKRGLKESEF